jgi:DNA-directed RNA polymerase subunit F
MASKPNIKDLFTDWNELNLKAQEYLGQFDFANIKEIRAKQNVIENSVFKILKENAAEDIIKILPDDCGEMEVGFEMEENRFYFVMFDPKEEDEEEPKLLAITIDLNKSVEVIEDFKME